MKKEFKAPPKVSEGKDERRKAPPKDNTTEETTEKKGFFSGLFGKKKKKDKDDTEANKSLLKKRDRKVEEDNSDLNKSPTEVEVNNINNTSDFDVERRYMSKKESEEVYGAKKMHQSVFLYAQSDKFLPIQKYINESFEGVEVVGTSSLSDVTSMFKEKTNVSNILLFVGQDQTLQILLPFLNMTTSIKKTNPELLSIYMVVTKDVNSEIIKEKEYSKFINIYEMGAKMDNISTDTVNQIMSIIVSKQPTYIEEEEDVRPPEVAVSKGSILADRPFELEGIDKLRERVAEARTQSTEKLETLVKNKIVSAKEIEDINNLKSLLPELNTLEEYSQALDNYIGALGQNLSPEQINKLAMSKLELSVVEEETIRVIFDKIVNVAIENAKEIDSKMISNSRTDAEFLKTLSYDEESVQDEKKFQELLSARESIKQKALEGFETYKKQVILISNAIEARKQLIQNVQVSLAESMNSIGEKGDIRNEISKVVTNQIVSMDEMKRKIVKDKSEIQEKMKSTLNYVSSVFKNYNILITVDDILLNKLVSEREKLKTENIQRIYEVDNTYSQRSKLMVANGVNELEGVLKLALQETTLMITTITTLDFGEKEVSSYENYMKHDHSYRPNVITLEREKNNEKDIDILVSKLKYTSKYYNKIIILLDGILDKSYIDIFIRTLPELVIITGTDKDFLVTTNEILTKAESIENLYAKTVMLYGFDNEKMNLADIRILAGLTLEIKQLIIKKAETKAEVLDLILILKRL